MFFLVVLTKTEEQSNNLNNLLSMRELIIMINLRLSNKYFYAIYLTKATYTFRSYSSYMFVVRWIKSIVTPKFIADLDDIISSLSSIMLRPSGIYMFTKVDYQLQGR